MNLATTILVLLQGIAVLVALGGVYSQLRLSRQTAQNDIYQSNVATFNQFLGSLANSAEVNSIFMRGRYSPDSLSVEEKERFFMLCAQYYGFHENLYIQYQRHGFSQDLYDGWNLDLQKNLHQDGFLAYWAEQGEEYTASFQRHVMQLASAPLKVNETSAAKIDADIERGGADSTIPSREIGNEPSI
jgi:hypothetical protein